MDRVTTKIWIQWLPRFFDGPQFPPLIFKRKGKINKIPIELYKSDIANTEKNLQSAPKKWRKSRATAATSSEGIKGSSISAASDDTPMLGVILTNEINF